MVFSGIVECKGEVLSIDAIQRANASAGITVVIKPQIPGFMNEDVSIGCSIAVNGVCLTVTKFTKSVRHEPLFPTFRTTRTSQ